MRSVTFFLLLAAIGLCVRPVWSADLPKIDRTIAKEPAYKGQPKYLRLVFGPEAKYRAWLVVDDEAVYVDRQGNGDLTEKGNRVLRSQALGDFSFDGGKVQYKNLTVRRRMVGKETMWTIEVDAQYRQRVNRDGQGRLTLADKPQDAPIVHFDGPLAMELLSFCDVETPVLYWGGKPSEIAASIGTPGLGKGTFAYVIPPKMAIALHPLAEVEFAHRDPNEKPLKLSVRLAVPEEGCLSFNSPIQVPADAAGTKAKVTLSFADWKEGKVAPRTCDVAIADRRPVGKPK